MSGECDKCGEHAIECRCVINTISLNLGYNINIEKPIYETLLINLDTHDFKVIKITRDGEKLTFPEWEFWQALKDRNDLTNTT